MRCSGALQHGCSEPEVARPKVFVVQPVMDVGRSALEEIADVEVHESDRMISKPDLTRRGRRCRLHLDAGRYTHRRRGDGGVTWAQGHRHHGALPKRGGCGSSYETRASGDRGPARDHQGNLRPDLRPDHRARLAAGRGRRIRPVGPVPPGAVGLIPHPGTDRQGAGDGRSRGDRDRDRPPDARPSKWKSSTPSAAGCKSRASRNWESSGCLNSMTCSSGRTWSR